MPELTFNESHNGERFSIHVGDRFSIRLSENSAGGFRWTLSRSDPLVDVIDHKYLPATHGVGSAGEALWQLVANRPGRARIELTKSRSWERADSATDRFVVELEILK
jgi:predicted secreted protein